MHVEFRLAFMLDKRNRGHNILAGHVVDVSLENDSRRLNDLDKLAVERIILTLRSQLINKAGTHHRKLVCIAAVRAPESSFPEIVRRYRYTFGNPVVRQYHSVPHSAAQLS
jgi:hypothetical protein